jgi:hypothetical protein
VRCGERLADEQRGRGEQRRGDERAAGVGGEETPEHGEVEAPAGNLMRGRHHGKSHAIREMIFRPQTHLQKFGCMAVS